MTLDCDLAEQLRTLLPRLAEALEQVERPVPATIALTRQEAADELRVSVRAVDGLIDSGELQAVRVGTRVVIPRRELERLLAPTKVRSRRSAA